MIGTVENGRTARLVSRAYQGEVSVRDYDDHMELCYFGSAPGQASFAATLDSQQIVVSNVVTRNLTRTKARPTDELLAVILIVRR